MMTVYMPGKKYECAEVKKIRLKMLITENGDEYMLMYDFAGQQYLYAVARGEGEKPEFNCIGKVILVEEEPERWRTWAGFPDQAKSSAN